jgi:hypothetical protein
VLLPDARITARSAGAYKRQFTNTNERGAFELSLPDGSYRIEVEKAGFKKAVMLGVLVEVNIASQQSIVLELGNIEDSVIVYADRLTSEDSVTASVILGSMMRRLPSMRFDYFGHLVPGIIPAGAPSHLFGRGGQNLGMDEHANEFTLQGLDNGDPAIRSFSFAPSIELIEEIKVLQGGANAEFGRNAGAGIAVTLRSGKDALHTSFWEFYRNDHLNARTWRHD